MHPFKYYAFDLLESTNETAKEFAPYDVIHALSQIKGKGRMGRQWESPKGNLFMSIVLPYTKEAPLYSFITSLSVAQTIQSLSPCIKWPNDILLNGQKVGGILLETSLNEPQKLIIGIGINIEHTPKGKMLYPVTCLKDNGLSISCIDLLNEILKTFYQNVIIFEQTGFSKIKQQWLNFASGLGQQICVKLPQKEMNGIFNGLRDDGALILQTRTKQQFITAGDIFMI